MSDLYRDEVKSRKKNNSKHGEGSYRFHYVNVSAAAGRRRKPQPAAKSANHSIIMRCSRRSEKKTTASSEVEYILSVSFRDDMERRVGMSETVTDQISKYSIEI